jgi:hypothetical protein
MFCQQCGTKNSPNAPFCGSCGAAVAGAQQTPPIVSEPMTAKAPKREAVLNPKKTEKSKPTPILIAAIIGGACLLFFIGSGESESSLRACRAEVPSNVKAIKMAQLIFDAETNRFLTVSSHPSVRAPGKNAQNWGRSSTGFNNLNWMPDGAVRGVYSASTTRATSRRPGGDFVVTGRIDCDGDGVEATYTATKSLNTMNTTRNDVY